jgi:hypothetical protein
MKPITETSVTDQSVPTTVVPGPLPATPEPSGAVVVTGMPQMLEPELAGLPVQSDDAPVPETVPDEDSGDDNGGARDDIASQGFVAFNRKLREEWWFERKPWSYGHLFLWLLCDANFKPIQRDYAGNVILVPRGAVLTSVLSLSKRAGVDRATVRGFIKKMTEAGEIRTLRSGAQGVVLQLVRYDEYTKINTGRYNRRDSRRSNP